MEVTDKTIIATAAVKFVTNKGLQPTWASKGSFNECSAKDLRSIGNALGATELGTKQNNDLAQTIRDFYANMAKGGSRKSSRRSKSRKSSLKSRRRL